MDSKNIRIRGDYFKRLNEIAAHAKALHEMSAEEHDIQICDVFTTYSIHPGNLPGVQLFGCIDTISEQLGLKTFMQEYTDKNNCKWFIYREVIFFELIAKEAQPAINYELF